jgi:uncharacterized protein YbjQ (UPF0145 family)
MLLTTTDSLDGRRIGVYLGVISADVVMGSNALRDFFAAIRDVIGGRAGSYEKIFTNAKKEALDDLSEKAKELGADAVIGIDMDYQIIGGDKKTLLMVSANGTAVKLA